MLRTLRIKQKKNNSQSELEDTLFCNSEHRIPDDPEGHLQKKNRR